MSADLTVNRPLWDAGPCFRYRAVFEEVGIRKLVLSLYNNSFPFFSLVLANLEFCYERRPYLDEVIGAKVYNIRSIEEYKVFYEACGDHLLLWRGHEMVLGGFALALQEAIAILALTPSSEAAPNGMKLYKYTPKSLQNFHAPPLPQVLSSVLSGPKLLLHQSSHYKVLMSKVAASSLERALEVEVTNIAAAERVAASTAREEKLAAERVEKEAAEKVVLEAATAAREEKLAEERAAEIKAHAEKEAAEKEATEKAAAERAATAAGSSWNAQPRYSCDFCDYVAKRRYHLGLHEAKVHGECARASCDLCEFVSTTSALASHHQREHIAGAVRVGKDFQCLTCGYTAAPFRVR